MENIKIKVIKIPVGERSYVDEIPNTLEALQEAVGGYIEIVRPFRDQALVLVMNEEGKLMNLPPTLVLKHKGEIIDLVAGEALLVYAPPSSEEFLSLPDDQIKDLISLLEVHRYDPIDFI